MPGRSVSLMPTRVWSARLVIIARLGRRNVLLVSQDTTRLTRARASVSLVLQVPSLHLPQQRLVRPVKRVSMPTQADRRNACFAQQGSTLLDQVMLNVVLAPLGQSLLVEQVVARTARLESMQPLKVALSVLFV